MVHSQLHLNELQLSFANDLAYLISCVESVETLLRRFDQLELLCVATRLTLKLAKCIIMPIGSATCDQWRAQLLDVAGADHPPSQVTVQSWAVYLGITLSRDLFPGNTEG
eukprot:4736232-Amphidinium_carterae.2